MQELWGTFSAEMLAFAIVQTNKQDGHISVCGLLVWEGFQG